MPDHPNSYLTIEDSSESIFKEKGSKFLGYARPVSSREEAEAFLTDIKSTHPKARHHCYAWRIRPVVNQTDSEPEERANDDGEPSGTAGRPILGQLVKSKVENAMIIIVRYFGGTLLGTSGLIQAYKTCAEMTLENASIIRIIEKETWCIELEFLIVHLLEEWAPKLDFDILERNHNKSRMKYILEIEKSKSISARKELLAKLLNVYIAEVDLEIIEYRDFKIKSCSNP